LVANEPLSPVLFLISGRKKRTETNANKAGCGGNQGNEGHGERVTASHTPIE
jgi:hypothetical protein